MTDPAIGPLLERLAALDQPTRTWLAARERAFSAEFSPKQGPLANVMSRLPGAAHAAARIGDGPRDDAYALLGELCDVYARADPATCAEIRETAHRHESRHLIEGYISHCAQRIASGGGEAWLVRGFAAAAIDDRRRDYRDWIMAVGEVYVAARGAGLDPSPVLRSIAERSSSRAHDAAPGSTQAALARYEESAYFAESVAPRIR